MIKYYFSNYNKNLCLEWNNVIGATKYVIYRRIIEQDNVFALLGETTDEKFNDDNITIDFLYPPEISVINQKDYGTIKVFIIDNAKNKRTYEYRIIAYEDDNVITTLKTEVDMFNKPDKYYYYLQDLSDTNAPKEYKISEDGCIILNSLENGKYIFYAAAEYKNLLSEYSSKRISVDNTIFINESECDIPNGVRYNNRYRGPQESKKKDNMVSIAMNNINKLKERYSNLERYQMKLYDKPDYTNNLICNKVSEIMTSSNDIRECIKYDQRNN